MKNEDLDLWVDRYVKIFREKMPENPSPEDYELYGEGAREDASNHIRNWMRAERVFLTEEDEEYYWDNARDSE